MALQAVLLDAVGTLIQPATPVAEVYCRQAAQLGVQVDRPVVAQRLAAALIRHGGGEQPTSEQGEWRFWQTVVAECFPECPAGQRRRLFESLWDHFAQPSSWQLYPDVADAWRRLETEGWPLSIASNFDQRLLRICQALPPLHRAQYVFTSAQVGFRKPNPRFFDQICRQLQLPPQACLMLGDQHANDVAAAQAAGWQALWLRREPIAPLHVHESTEPDTGRPSTPTNPTHSQKPTPADETLSNLTCLSDVLRSIAGAGRKP